MDIVRSLVRPAITALLVGAFVVAAFWDGAAADRLEQLTLVVVAFWFGQRTANGT